MAMKVSIIGAGPAGLYAAIRLKQANANADIQLFEQNSADVTWGFGVVFSHESLGFLRKIDPQTADLIEPEMESWSDIAINHKGEHIRIDGVGFRAIGRLQLLRLLQRRASQLGITPIYERQIDSLSKFGTADLVIGADGFGSIVRSEAPQAYGEHISTLRNRFVWYGATRAFDRLTQTFKATAFGPFNAHHYRYAPDRSTFLIECGEETFAAAGFDSMPEPEYRNICQQIFADELDGAELVDNNSIWRRFPDLTCSTFHHGNRVLVGDALHTAHFSIGSGTRLALEDVIALVQALQDEDFDVDRALPAYQRARQPILKKLKAAARSSANWYEQFGANMELAPWPFAKSYILRAGRIDARRLARVAPIFSRSLHDHGIN
jgi:2-polyprenyl-6-methoxyphenol hydroxylase-like FAD-dependent oxidoreductase